MNFLTLTTLEETSQKEDFRKDIKIPVKTNSRLEALMFGLGIKTKSRAVERLLDEFAKENPEILEAKIATLSNVLDESAPVCIFGKPGSGKSWTLRKLVLEASEQKISVILVDIANEYLDVGRKMTTGSSISRRFRQGIYRIVAEKEPRTRQFSIQRLFEHLTDLAFRGKLKDFFVAIDEGNELKEIKEVYDFLIESRKFLRKAVIVSADPRPFASICVAMRPYPKILGL